MKLHQALAAAAMTVMAPTTWAVDVAYDFVACNHSRRLPLEANADLVAFGVETFGTVASSTTKAFEGATTHCVGYVRVMAGKPVGKGVCKWLVTSGDTAVGAFEMPAGGEPVFTWLSGTGGLKGISGKGTFRELTPTKPIEPGTSQGCRRDWGSFTVPSPQ